VEQGARFNVGPFDKGNLMDKQNLGCILVVDDEPNMCETLQIFLETLGYEVYIAQHPDKALTIVRETAIDVVLSDFRMPGMTGLELLKQVKSLNSDIEVLIMTAYVSVDDVVEVMREGAYDYIEKPFQLDMLQMTLQKVREKQRLYHRNRELEEEIEKKYSFDQIVGKSDSMGKVFELIRKVAPSESTVLITGDSGTGKELVARAIHQHSQRKNNPFVAINCGGIPLELLESELFGYEKGAFTGAAARKKGLFETAENGTLFLDEVGELPLSLQVKLLRVLQDGMFRRVGGLDNIQANVRILAATNRDLQQMVKEKTFREDLYFRFNVIPIKLPSLNERQDDIPLLLEHFLDDFCQRKSIRKKPRFSPAAMKYLMSYSWPGNVRELENLVERLLILVDRDVIEPDDLPEKITSVPVVEFRGDTVTYAEAKQDFEREYFQRLLEKYNWNVTRAAEEADMSRRNLHEKIRILNLTPPWENSNPT